MIIGIFISLLSIFLSHVILCAARDSLTHTSIYKRWMIWVIGLLSSMLLSFSIIIPVVVLIIIWMSDDVDLYFNENSKILKFIKKIVRYFNQDI